MIAIEDATTLSSLYHLNSEPWLNTDAYQQPNDFAALRCSAAEHAARLPLPAPPGSHLGDLIHKRSSCRQYQKRPMPTLVLAGLLTSAYGLTRRVQLPDQVAFFSRSVPSAGGLFPLDLYVLAQRIEGVSDGLYRYEVFSHSLNLVRAGARFQDVREAFIVFPFVEDCNALVFLSAVFTRTQKKYGPRGYRYILLEAGHSAQNLCLAATEQNLGSLC